MLVGTTIWANADAGLLDIQILIALGIAFFTSLRTHCRRSLANRVVVSRGDWLLSRVTSSCLALGAQVNSASRGADMRRRHTSFTRRTKSLSGAGRSVTDVRFSVYLPSSLRN
jgi:hypothetical protein